MRQYVFGLVLTLFVNFVGTANAAPWQFTVDPNQSYLTITPSTLLFGTTPLPSSPQGDGAFAASYSGTVDAEITSSTIQLLGSTSLVAGISGNWKPGADFSNYPADNGDPNGYINTAAPANYGVVTDLMAIGQSSASASAVRDLIISLADSAPKPLVAGAFEEAGTLTDFISGTTYFSAGASPPTTDMAGTISPDPLVDATGTGSLTQVGNLRTLTIPIRFTVTYPVAVLVLSTTYEGVIVATAVPEPASASVLVAALLVGGCLARRRY